MLTQVGLPCHRGVERLLQSEELSMLFRSLSKQVLVRSCWPLPQDLERGVSATGTWYRKRCVLDFVSASNLVGEDGFVVQALRSAFRVFRETLECEVGHLWEASRMIKERIALYLGLRTFAKLCFV
jgi:hypothetical protein